MSRDSRQVIDDVIRHISNGNVEQGLSLCRSKLEDSPDDVNLIALLGAILIRTGDFDDAERYLLRAIELEPEFAKPHEDLGALYLERNEAERAVTFFERVVALGDPQPAAVKGLAVALHRSGRVEEAELIRAQHFVSVPTSPTLSQAHALRAAGDRRGAEKLCQGLLETEPGNIMALRLLAFIATDEENFTGAENLLRRIVSLAPESAAAAHDLARFLGDRGRYPEAIELLEPVTAKDNAYPDVQRTLGDMLGIVGRSADALLAYENCLAKRPDDPPALLGRAHMLRIEGESEEAVKCYRQCINTRPEFGDAWWNLATMRDYEASDEDVSSMLKLLESGAVAEGSEIPFRFALARAFEKRDDYERAWEQYVKGNAAKRALVKYDPVEIESQNRAIKEVFDASLPGAKSASTPSDVTPIFVLGVPRSGSTLIEQILASHSSVAGCGELPYIIMLSTTVAASRSDGLRYPKIMNELDESQLTGLGRSYLHYAMSHNVDGKPLFTDKMPANFSHVGFINQILPHAKIIDARREPLATCIANFRQLFAQGKNQSYDLTELGEYYLQYVDMMNHWDEVLPGTVLRVHYEDVVANIESQVRRILDYCELPFEEACVDFYKSTRAVNTASSEQVRQPLYSSAVDFWKNYEPYLDELREVLEPVLQGQTETLGR
jgi:tetratricopeptide (TPR) repeat protein